MKIYIRFINSSHYTRQYLSKGKKGSRRNSFGSLSRLLH